MAAQRVPRNAPVPVEPPVDGSDPAFPYGVPAPRIREEEPDADLPTYISEAHRDSEPTAPAPSATASSTAAQRDRSASPTAGRTHATTADTAPQDSSTGEDKSAKAFTLPIRTDVFAGLAIVIAALFFMSIGMTQATDFGAVKLQWQFATCLFGLAAAGLCIPFVPAAVRYARILFTEGAKLGHPGMPSSASSELPPQSSQSATQCQQHATSTKDPRPGQSPRAGLTGRR